MTRDFATRFLFWLVTRLTPNADREWVCGDIEEEHERIVSHRGVTAGRAWLRAEAWRVITNVFRHHRAVRARERTWRRTVSATKPKGDDVMRTLAQDLRYASRVLRRAPGFTAVALLMLAIGVGASTAIFSVVYGVLLRPLPYPEPERIVRLWERTEKGVRVSLSNPNFQDWRQRNSSFEAMSAYAGGRETVLGGAEPVFASVHRVSGDFFRVFGVRAARGRTFTAEEGRPGAPPAVVVSHLFWRRALASNPALETLQLRVAGVVASVVGVMPQGFAYPAQAEVWIPTALFEDTTGRTGHNYAAVGRIRPEVPLSQARAEMSALAAALQREHAGNNDAIDVTIVPLQEALTGSSRDALVTLLGAVGLVLLIACANVGSLLLARGEERRAELAIRAALGAGRFRIVRQLLIENLLLSGVAAAAGLLLAGWLLRALLVMHGDTLPGADAIGIDRAVLLFTLGLAVGTPLLFGLVPALQISRVQPGAALAVGGRAIDSSVRTRARRGLIALEVAVALVLLVSAALLLRSFQNILAIDAGFDPRGTITAEMAVPVVRYPEPDQAAAFYAELLPHVRSVPGIRAAGAITQLPLSGGNAGGGFQFEGGDATRYAGYRVITDGYFEAMGIPLLHGRFIGPEDEAGREPVAVVSATFLRNYLPTGHGLGRRFRYRGMDRVNPTFTIVGVVGDVRHQSLLRDVQPEVYVAYRQQPFRTRWTMTLVVRAERPALVDQLVPVVRDRVRAVDPDVPVRFSTLDEVVGTSIADRRFTATVLASFAGVALLLSAAGIYSVLAYSVEQRTHEIGIRMALGADRRSVMRLLLREGLVAAGAGLAIGLAVAFALTRLLRTLLFGVLPLDPPAFAAAIVVLGLSAVIAGYVPARRATRVDPLAALRE